MTGLAPCRPACTGRAGLALLALLALGSSPAGAGRVAGSGPTAGCRSSAFDTSTDVQALVLTFSTPPSTPILATELVHPCPGPVHVNAALTGILLPTLAEGAIFFAQPALTCVAGCPVTGVRLDPPLTAPLGLTTAQRDSGQEPAFFSIPLVAVFPDLPPGTYRVEVLAAGFHAILNIGTLQAQSLGAQAGAGRP